MINDDDSYVDEAFQKIESSWDRFQEAHFWLHSMEDAYHYANRFRWCFNAFLRSLKEVPQLLTMETQKHGDLKSWYKQHKTLFLKDPLLQVLSKNRDFIVHQAMLLPESTGAIGITEMKGMKFGMNISINALEDSDIAMDSYLLAIRDKKDVLGILDHDEDSVPCVKRQWKIKEFDVELVELSATAWLRLSETMRLLFEQMGVVVPPHILECRHSLQDVQFKIYEREALKERMRNL